MKNNRIQTQVNAIKKKKLAKKKLISLAEYREVSQDEERKSVLVVDDDEIMRNAMRRILENEGYLVKLAHDGIALSKELEKSAFDLVLLDVNLPWVDGFELCRILQSNSEGHTPPVIMVSAQKSPEDIQQGLDAGAKDYITKPFEVGDMTRTVRKILEEKAG